MINTGTDKIKINRVKNKFIKKLLKIMLVAVFVAVAGYGVYTSQKTNNIMSELMLANVEALANDELVKTYETVKKDEIEIWDDNAGVYKKVVTIVCDDPGTASCE